MSSSKSTNSWGNAGHRLALYGLLLACLASAGCRKQQAKRPPVPRPVYVRLAPLLAAHPQQREVDRLRIAEQRLRQLSLATINGAGNTQYSLSALAPDRRAGVSLAMLTAREKAQVDRITVLARTERDSYLEGYRARQLRLAEQQETEMRGQLVARDAEKERKERERIYQEIIDQLTLAPADGSALTDQMAVLNARIAVLEAQLQNPEIPLIVLNKEGQPVFEGEAERIVREELTRLDANPKVSGVSERSRLEHRHIIQEAKRQDVAGRVEDIKANGEKRIAAVAADAAAQRDKEIADYLNQMQTDPTLMARLIRQEGAINDALAFDRAMTEASLRAVTQNGGGMARIEISGLLGGASPSVITAESTGRAADRIAAQRQRLEETIQKAVRMRIRDIADTRNLDVVVVPGGQTAAAGRTDETPSFVRALATGSL